MNDVNRMREEIMGVSMKETIRKRGSRGDIWWRDGVKGLDNLGNIVVKYGAKW